MDKPNSGRGTPRPNNEARTARQTFERFVDLFANAVPSAGGGGATPAPHPQSEWIQIGLVGEWKGHPKGPEKISAEHLRSALNFFNSTYAANGTDLVIDYDHASLAAMYSGEKAPAAGWITAMELRAGDTQLWANVDWTDTALAMLNRREYRFISPVFSYNYKSPVSGDMLPMVCTCVGLTNRPFMRELPAVAASETAAGMGEKVAHNRGGQSPQEEAVEKLLEKLAKAQGIEAPAFANGLGCAVDAADEVVLHAVASKLKPAAPPPADPRLAIYANALGVDAPADKLADAVKLRLDALASGGKAVVVIANSLELAPDSKVEEIVARIGALKTAAVDQAAEKVLSNAIEGKKIPPAQREKWLKLLREKPAETTEIINSLTPILSGPSGASGSSAGPVAELAAEEKTLAHSLGVAESDLAADKTAFLNSQETRNEFKSLQTFLAFRAAERTGRVRLYGAKMS